MRQYVTSKISEAGEKLEMLKEGQVKFSGNDVLRRARQMKTSKGKS